MGRSSRRRRERRETDRPVRRFDRSDGSKLLQITDPALAAQVTSAFEAQAASFREKFGRVRAPMIRCSSIRTPTHHVPYRR